MGEFNSVIQICVISTDVAMNMHVGYPTVPYENFTSYQYQNIQYLGLISYGQFWHPLYRPLGTESRDRQAERLRE